MKLGPREYHPYGVFLPKNASSIIIGTFPIAKFTTGKNLKSQNLDFFYGGEKNQLWKILSLCFGLELKNKNQIITFLKGKGIGMADVIKSCQRINGGSQDSDLKNCEYFTDLKEIIKNTSINKIYFTSVKVRHLFKSKIGRIGRLEEILLISPSGGGLRHISKEFGEDLKNWKKKNPKKNISEFRIYSYLKIFKKG